MKMMKLSVSKLFILFELMKPIDWQFKSLIAPIGAYFKIGVGLFIQINLWSEPTVYRSFEVQLCSAENQFGGI